MRTINKKGQLNTLTSSILAIALAIISFVFILTVLASLQTTAVENGTVFNETATAITGYAGFGDYWGLIILAIVIAVVFGLIFFAFGKGGR